MDTLRCKKPVYDQTVWGYKQCLRNTWKDGFCKQHHPDTVDERKKKKRPDHLMRAFERIMELEADVKELKKQLEAICTI